MRAVARCHGRFTAITRSNESANPATMISVQTVTARTAGCGLSTAASDRLCGASGDTAEVGSGMSIRLSLAGRERACHGVAVAWARYRTVPAADPAGKSGL